MKTPVTRLLTSFCVLVMTTALPALNLGDVFPTHGVAGESVVIQAGEVNLGATHTATVGGAAAVISGVTAQGFTVVIPAGAAHGGIEISDGTITRQTRFPIEISREISGQFVPPAGVAASGYAVGTLLSLVQADAGGHFTVRLPRDYAGPLWATRGRGQPVFLAVVLPDMPSVVINAASTARGMIFMLAPYVRRAPLEAAQVLAHIDTLAGVNDLAAAITAYSADGASYFEDVRVQAVIEEVYEAALTLPPPPPESASGDFGPGNNFKAGQPGGTALRDLNPDFETSLPATAIRLNSVLSTTTTTAGKLVFKLDDFDPDKTNPADWFVQLFEISPQTLTSFQAINNLTHSQPIITPASLPVATGLVRANLKSSNGDLVERLSEWLLDSVTGDEKDGPEPNHFLVDAARPGIYLAHSYSGNLWYGTEFFFTQGSGRLQTGLMTQTGGYPAWYAAIANNVIIATFNAMAAAGFDPLKILDNDRMESFFENFFFDFNKAIGAYLVSPGGSPRLDAVGVRELLQTTYYAMVKGLVALMLNELEDEGVKVLVRWLGEGTQAFFASQIDITGRISDGLQAVERLAGLLTPDALALERSVFVIGNPFDPRIRSFAPKRGCTGDIVTLHGENFGSEIADITISFLSFNGTVDPNDPLEVLPVGNSVTAPVLDVSDTMVTIRVPEGMAGQFPGNLAFIGVLRTGKSLTTTFSNHEPFRTFEFIPPPTLTGVEPAVPASGQALVAITGMNFDPAAVELYRVGIAGPGNPTAETRSITEDRVLVSVSTTQPGLHTLVLYRRDKTLGSVNFTAQNPAETGVPPGDGIRITATSPSLANSPDNVISLGEAMLIAAGQLGRAPTSDGNKNDDNILEEDYISVFGNVNEITYTGPSPVVLPSQLPPLAAGWIYHLPMLDGSSLGPGVTGLHVTVDGVTVSVGLRNFSGHGLHVTGGAKNCRLLNIDIETPGGHGVFLDGSASDNHFFNIRVTNPGGHGAFLTGAGVVRNNFRNTLDTAAPTQTTVFSSFDGSLSGYGILIENGASFNGLSFHKLRGNQLGGACVRGEACRGNIIGWGSKVRPPLREVSNNGGHGVLITDDASHTVCRWLHLNNNRGDGILVDGTSHNHIQGIYTGFVEVITGPSQYRHIAAPAEQRNDGHGIRLTNGAAFNVIGSTNNGTFFERGCIANNTGSGIVLEGAGTDFNLVGKHNIGDLETFDGFTVFYATLAEAQAGSGTRVDLSNGEQGVVVRNGASNNIIGGENSTLDLHISGASNGAGILIDSTAAVCASNEIIGNQIGSETNTLTQPGLPRVGIHLKGPCRGTSVGRPGVLQHAEITPVSGDFVSNPFYSFRPYNVIGSCTEAGILLEQVANTSGDPNLIHNNFIGCNDGTAAYIDFETIPSRVGIKLTGDCSGNHIGGGESGEGNRVRWNAEYGILLENMPAPAGGGRNEFRNNLISGSGDAASQFFFLPGMPRVPKPVDNLDPLVGAASGTGVVFRGVTSQSVVFGESITAANDIHDNEVGVHFDTGSGGALAGCHIHDNRVGGVVLTQAGLARVGSSQGAAKNCLHSNGDAALMVSGGVLVIGGTGAVISGNWIGLTPQGVLNGNIGVGVRLQDCASVILGGHSQPHGNTIGGSTSHGVLITGAGAQGNRLEFNHIGTDAAGNARNNNGDGVRVENGASGNFVGGDRAYVSAGGALKNTSTRNIIAFNVGQGVNVAGAAAGNRILHNSIFSNGGQGILHTGGGNNNQVPPITAVFGGSVISGHVPGLGAIPAGSVIEAFADRNPVQPEGEVFLGGTTVRPDGTWTIALAGPIPFVPTLTLTATNAITGSTSQFGQDAGFQIGFRAFRTDEQPPGARNIELGPQPAVVLGFSLGALNADVAVRSLTFSASGSLNEATELIGAALYRDHDADGLLSAGDPLIAEPMAFTSNDAQIEFQMESLTIEANYEQRFLLVYLPAGIIPAGRTFAASLQAVNDVAADYHFPPATAAVPLAGDFPLVSDTFTTLASALQSFLTLHFGVDAANPLIGGPEADPDGDGLSNLAEYFFGLDPNLPDAHRARQEVRQENGSYVITFTRPVGAGAGLGNTRLEASHQLTFWTDAATQVQLGGISIIDNEDGTETVSVVADTGAADRLFFRFVFFL